MLLVPPPLPLLLLLRPGFYNATVILSKSWWLVENRVATSY